MSMNVATPSLCLGNGGGWLFSTTRCGKFRCAAMLNFDDERWDGLRGGYRIPFDPRPSLLRLEVGTDVDGAWHELWEELHHQGDVGEASYAAVPHLVRIHGQRGFVDWNTYGIVATIELARGQGKNPAVPKWLEEDYFDAIQELAKLGSVEVLRAEGRVAVRAILGILAIAKGARTHGRFLVDYSEEELLDIESPE
jgi:hypothetical protein